MPTGAVFDPALAGSNAPLTRAEVAAARREVPGPGRGARQGARGAGRAGRGQGRRDRRSCAQQIKAAQAANTLPDTHDYSEAQTRELIIDELLREAGWQLTEDRDREFEVTGMPNAEGIGFVDYVLWGADGLPLAVVEAKRPPRSPAVGQQQAKLYADCLEQMTGRRPVIFYTNGYEPWLWDDAAGYPPRQVQGFYTSDELELMVAAPHHPARRWPTR